MKRNWSNLLIENIVQKIEINSIVPIIGPDAFEASLDGNPISIQKYIVCELLKNNLPEYNTPENVEKFSANGLQGMTRLYKLFEEKRLTLSNRLYALFGKGSKLWNNISLKKNVFQFIQNGRFPLIITTCRFPISTLCPKIHGKDYKTVSYARGGKDEQDITFIEDRKDIASPTIFHLLGAYSIENDSCVITEDDFLSYLHALQDPSNRPSKLIRYLAANKYVFAIGCNIPDWTLRFLLFSLKEEGGKLKNDNGRPDNFVGGVLEQSLDNDLIEFLEDIRYFPSQMVDTFLEEVNSTLKPKEMPHMFLSLCSEEYEKIGRKLRDICQEKFEVWFFEDDGDNHQYWKSIKDGLQQADYIIPIITDKALNKIYQYKKVDANEKRNDVQPGLIDEWEMAMERHIPCCPLYIDTTNASLKTAINEKCVHLWDFFQCDDGNAGLTIDLNTFSATDLTSHLKI